MAPSWPLRAQFGSLGTTGSLGLSDIPELAPQGGFADSQDAGGLIAAAAGGLHDSADMLTLHLL